MKKIYFISILAIAIISACNEKNTGENKTETKTSMVAIAAPPVPADFTELKQAKGDLDKDGKDELVIVYDTKHELDMGTERQIYIYKEEGPNWKLWHKSIGAVLPSQHGGVMGDPFQDITIERGCIVIDHFGGSREKWSYKHRYRYQDNNWYLIGATIDFGAPCDGPQEHYDYNLSTGHVDGEIKTISCDDNGNEVATNSTTQMVSFPQKPTHPVLMDGFYPGGNEVKIPGGEKSFYY